MSFEEWLSQQDGVIEVDCGCVTTEAFYHWMRVAYEAGNSPVIPEGWQVEAEKLAEMHGMSFVIFRNGQQPECADPTRLAISFTSEDENRIRERREEARREMSMGARITSHRFIPKVR